LSGADVGAFITVSGLLIGSSDPFRNDISSRVKKALGFFFNGQLIHRLRGALILQRRVERSDARADGAMRFAHCALRASTGGQ
jgi:hypothetical protein